MTDQAQAISVIKNGGLVVMPTDTIAGLVASAFNQEVVEKIYKIKERDLDKPFIILISNIKDLEKFDIYPTTEQEKFLLTAWPGAVSVILKCPSDRFTYLHRGTGTLAFRLPALDTLKNLIEETGPLVAPSANKQAQTPAQNNSEARAYFGDLVGFYWPFEGGAGKPSTLISLVDGVKIVRQGETEITV